MRSKRRKVECVACVGKCVLVWQIQAQYVGLIFYCLLITLLWWCFRLAYMCVAVKYLLIFYATVLGIFWLIDCVDYHP